MAVIQGLAPDVPTGRIPEVPIASEEKEVTTRRITYNVQAIQSQRGQTIRRGGDPQKDWMRWRQSENAILNLLDPDAKRQILAAGLTINAEDASGSIENPGGRIYYNPIQKRLNLPSNMPEDWIRHELTHAGLALTPHLFPEVGAERRFASGRSGSLINMVNENVFRNETDRHMLVETAAITMGGAFAYPGYQPAYRPEQFSNFFNTQVDSWQYPAQSGWNVTPESKWKTYR